MNLDLFFKDDANFPGQFGPQFQRFVRRRKVMRNVTTKTLMWYAGSWKAIREHVSKATDERSLRMGLEDAVEALSERGCGPTTINTYMRCAQAWINFMLVEEVISKPIKLEKLRCERVIRNPLSEDDCSRLFNYRPRNQFEQLIHAAIVLCLDAGLRSMEWRMLRTEDIDLVGQTVKVAGKGRRQRIIPVSYECVRVLRAYLNTRDEGFPLTFATTNGTPILHRNAYRRITKLCAKVGVRPVGVHGLRHTFGSRYAINGGSIGMLQSLLGHSSLSTTEKYVHIALTEAHQAHVKFSPIAKAAKRITKPAA